MKTIGKYELLASIGDGGMANVFLARHRGVMGFEKILVVKTILPHLAKDKRFVEMFLDEARLAAQINHQHVVQVYDLGETDGIYYMVMEYLAGESLTGVLEQVLTMKRLLPLSVGLRIVADAASGLHAAHELKTLAGKPLDVVHRDVSLGNIIVLYNGNTKVVDFGIAKAKDRLSHTVGSEIKGKFSYMSPEQIEGKPIDRRSDIFSLGVVLWETLTLRRLFSAPNYAAALQAILSGNVDPPSKHREDISSELDKIVLRSLALDPSQRFQTAQELHYALERCLPRDGASVEACMKELFTDRMTTRQQLLEKMIESKDPMDVEELQRTMDNFRIEVSKSAYLLPEKAGKHKELEVESGDVLLDMHEKSVRTTRSKQRLRWLGSLTVTSVAMLGMGMVISGVWPYRDVIRQVATSFVEKTPSNTVTVGEIEVLQMRASDEENTENRSDSTQTGVKKSNARIQGGKVTKIKKKPQASADRLSDKNVQRPLADTAKAQKLYDDGIRLVVEGKLLKAEKAFRQALSADKDYAPAYRGLGLLYEQAQDYAKAIEYLRAYLVYSKQASDAELMHKRISELETKQKMVTSLQN